MNDRFALRRGIYTVPEAARLLEVSPRKVRGWIAGYPKTKSDPILDNELGVVDNRLAMSFTNLMEVRFINAFSRFGVKVAAIRVMLEEAKELLKHPHPFATKAIFRTDGHKIFVTGAEQTGDKALYDLKSKNWAMHEVIAQSLLEGVEFDADGDAVAYHPREQTPGVIVRPAWSFGKPVLKGAKIPTRTIFESFCAEEETEESVAHWFGISRDEVREAVKFETLLKQAA